MASSAWCQAFFMLLIISQAYSSHGQNTYPEKKAVDDDAIKALEAKIRYQFNNQMLVMRAITHATYSIDNNDGLKILGSNVIQAAISLQYIFNSPSINKKDLMSKLSEYFNCTTLSQDALNLRLHELVRVAPKVNPKGKSILCDCYHALFGAIGVDAKNLDVAREKLWRRHGWNITQIMNEQLIEETLHLEG